MTVFMCSCTCTQQAIRHRSFAAQARDSGSSYSSASSVIKPVVACSYLIMSCRLQPVSA